MNINEYHNNPVSMDNQVQCQKEDAGLYIVIMDIITNYIKKSRYY